MNIFAEHVTSSAFNLSLSKAMIEALCYYNQYGWGYASRRTINSLENRGLIQASNSEERRFTHELTDAGRAVMPLLKLSGLYIELPALAEPVPIPEVKIKIKVDYEGLDDER